MISFEPSLYASGLDPSDRKRRKIRIWAKLHERCQRDCRAVVCCSCNPTYQRHHEFREPSLACLPSNDSSRVPSSCHCDSGCGRARRLWGEQRCHQFKRHGYRNASGANPSAGPRPGRRIRLCASGGIHNSAAACIGQHQRWIDNASRDRERLLGGTDDRELGLGCHIPASLNSRRNGSNERQSNFSRHHLVGAGRVIPWARRHGTGQLDRARHRQVA